MTACKQPAGALAGFLLILAVPPLVGTDEPRWHDDVAAAQAEAQKTGKPIFAVFR